MVIAASILFLSAGQAKRNNPLAGANQFHKKKKKKH
jgi:hypothetical protein